MIFGLHSNRFELVSTEMSLTDDFGLSFNCGFCRTLVYECLSGKGTKGGKKKEKGASEKGNDKSGTHRDGSENDKDNKEVRPNLVETFKSHFIGPRFSIGADYFESTAYRPLLFERDVKRLMKSWSGKFNPCKEASLKQMYLSTFSSLKWNMLSLNDKGAHSLSKCYPCAKTYPKLQKSLSFWVCQCKKFH